MYLVTFHQWSRILGIVPGIFLESTAFCWKKHFHWPGIFNMCVLVCLCYCVFTYCLFALEQSRILQIPLTHCNCCSKTTFTFHSLFSLQSSWLGKYSLKLVWMKQSTRQNNAGSSSRLKNILWNMLIRFFAKSYIITWDHSHVFVLSEELEAVGD